MNELKRSNDRKTANMSKQSGDKWQSKIKNAFGLPAGKEFSCVGETPFCGGICYGKRIEGYLPSVSRFSLLTLYSYQYLDMLHRSTSFIHTFS